MNRQPPVIKGWILHGDKTNGWGRGNQPENDRCHQCCLWHRSHFSRVRSRLFFYPSSTNPQPPAPPHGSPSPPLANGPGRPEDPPWPVRVGDCSGPAPLHRYDHTRWSLDGLFFLQRPMAVAGRQGCRSDSKTWNQQRKGEKKRKPYAALPLCHQILHSTDGEMRAWPPLPCCRRSSPAGPANIQILP